MKKIIKKCSILSIKSLFITIVAIYGSVHSTAIYAGKRKKLDKKEDTQQTTVVTKRHSGTVIEKNTLIAEIAHLKSEIRKERGKINNKNKELVGLMKQQSTHLELLIAGAKDLRLGLNTFITYTEACVASVMPSELKVPVLPLVVNPLSIDQGIMGRQAQLERIRSYAITQEIAYLQEKKEHGPEDSKSCRNILVYLADRL